MSPAYLDGGRQAAALRPSVCGIAEVVGQELVSCLRMNDGLPVNGGREMGGGREAAALRSLARRPWRGTGPRAPAAGGAAPVNEPGYGAKAWRGFQGRQPVQPFPWKRSDFSGPGALPVRARASRRESLLLPSSIRGPDRPGGSRARVDRRRRADSPRLGSAGRGSSRVRPRFLAWSQAAG